MLSSNMCAGISGDDLMVDSEPATQDEAPTQDGELAFDLIGRPMNDWMVVDDGVLGPDAALSVWVERGLDFAGKLPPK